MAPSTLYEIATVDISLIDKACEARHVVLLSVLHKFDYIRLLVTYLLLVK